ncbi:MAG: primosomal protein N' [Bacteroidales bacterium]|nr:primosomal protein N' [Bacteroidales bacterium]
MTAPLTAEVILPVSFCETLTYLVPEELREQIAPGCRVLVPLRGKQAQMGIVMALHEALEVNYKLKDIKALVDLVPVMSQTQLSFWKWIASYYACKIGEVMMAALPTGLKSEDAYKAKTESVLYLSPLYRSELSCQELLHSLQTKAKKQYLLLERILSMKSEEFAVRKADLLLLDDSSPAALKALIDKGILEVQQQEVSRLKVLQADENRLLQLSPAQEQAYREIHQHWQTKDICLLHGVTSSGKTEIYSRLINEVLAENKQVLYLLPEIALTTQMTQRLKKIFGPQMLIYHSKCSMNERVEMWHRILQEDGPLLVVGVRSSVFLPFTRLGLVVVDEEHEISYKQSEPAPRYHARNAALMLAKMHHAKAILGSATPSLESYTKAREGRYGLVNLTQRYRDIQLPEIILADINEAKRKKELVAMFTPTLVENMQACLQAGEQIILFHNRRGYASVMSCKECDWTPHCERCDVPLTYHKESHSLRCHYCGRQYPIPSRCPSCGKAMMASFGFGTEQVEEALHQLFPQARVARMDTDVLHERNAIGQLIEDFEQQKTDILIGTQMLTKGLDFDHVALVGVLNADTMLNQNDFRAHERAFQLMVQVSGRAGRKGRRGRVVLQTRDPEQPLIQRVLHYDYLSYYVDAMKERHAFCYPPYCYLIDVWFKHASQAKVQQAAQYFANVLQPLFPDMVFGPFEPAVAKVRDVHIQKLSLKIAPSQSLLKIKDYLCGLQAHLQKDPLTKQVQIYFDVDPL